MIVDRADLPALGDLLDEFGADPAIQDLCNQWRIFADARVQANLILSGEHVHLSEFWEDVLDPHQATAVTALSVPGLIGACLFDEQGSGKTVMAIAAFDMLRESSEIDRMIILCPKIMIGEWRKDFAKLLGEKYVITAVDDATTTGIPQGFEQCDVYLTNYEGLSRVGLRLELTAESTRTLLVVDESFFLKNVSAARTQLAVRLRAKCARGLVLCGTPAPNSYEDVIAQCSIADGGYAFSGFVDKGRDSVAARLEEKALVIRRQKSAIMPNLAAKSIRPVLVTMGARQRCLYEEAKNNLVLHLRTLDNRAVIKATDGYFEKLHALVQLCSWPASIDPTFREDPAKVLALDDLLSNLIEAQGKKVVLWSAYKDPIPVLAARYKQYAPVVVSGDTPARDRSAAVLCFQTEPGTKLFIGNPSAAGAGITLTAASDAVFFSFSNRAADFLQAIDRIHRRGQVASEVVIHILLCDSSIERAQLDRLLSKERSQGELLRDKELGTRVEDAIAALLASD